MARADHARGESTTRGIHLMAKIQLATLAVALTLSAPAQAGMLDWFQPGAWFSSFTGLFSNDEEKARGFYVGGGAGVVRADWGVQRRVGGPTDPSSPTIRFQNEPAMLTTANLRFGWQPFSWLEAEAEWNFDLDKDQISEEPNRRAELDSLSGIYLRPQLHIGNAQLFVEVGYNQISINMTCGDPQLPSNPSDADIAFRDSCQNFDESGIAYGAGIGFHLSSAAKLTFTWRQLYDDDFDDNGRNDDARAVMIGVTAGFGGGGDDFY